MKFEVVQSNQCEHEWVVEAINLHQWGYQTLQVFRALFSGPCAKARANEYAAWKNIGAPPITEENKT